MERITIDNLAFEYAHNAFATSNAHSGHSPKAVDKAVVKVEYSIAADLGFSPEMDGQRLAYAINRRLDTTGLAIDVNGVDVSTPLTKKLAFPQLKGERSRLESPSAAPDSPPGSDTTPSSGAESREEGNAMLTKIIIAAVASSCLLISMVFSLYVCRRRRSKLQGSNSISSGALNSPSASSAPIADPSDENVVLGQVMVSLDDGLSGSPTGDEKPCQGQDIEAQDGHVVVGHPVSSASSPEPVKMAEDSSKQTP